MKFASAILLAFPFLSQAVSASGNNTRGLKKGKKGKKYFNRISNFLICDQVGSSCFDDDFETVAEIVAATEDGMTLVYTDSEQENIGFVDITDPTAPVGMGTVDLVGEPTSVSVSGDYAAVGVNTSPDYLNPRGRLDIVEISSMTIVKTIYLGGQPDSVAFSPDGDYIVVAIENERDEDLGEGIPPQMPAGFVVVIDSKTKHPRNWRKNVVDVTGLPGVGIPEDPEPEYVDVNGDNVAVVTLQENNAIVLIDLATLNVTNSFTAGTVDLENIDTEEEGVIDQTSSLEAVPREPDGVTWINTMYFATADEGDMDGGSRGFTIFDTDGNVIAGSGSEFDQIAAQLGHYPEERSGNKGSEPENVSFGKFGGNKLLMVNAERSNIVFVYNINKIDQPEFIQALPTSVGPEGSLTIPDRDLLVVACEKDDRGDGFRSTLSIFEYGYDAPVYPSIKSFRNKSTGVAIPWSAMSGLSPGEDKNTLYAVEDSFYNKNRFFKINTNRYPYIVKEAITIMDSDGVLAAVPTDTEFTAEDLSAMINDDGSVNIDQEGIAYAPDGSLWIVSEGKGTAGTGVDSDVTTINLVLHVSAEGVIKKAVTLPADIAMKQLKWGLEGIAYAEGMIIVCLQRPWQDMDHPKILMYDIEANEWVGHVQYPLDDVASPAGGWIGLADITYKGDGVFYILERDNQGGPDAAVKKVYSVDLMSYSGEDEIVEKTLVIDLLPILIEATQGLVPEKIEGLAYTEKGLFLINDNDGVDDNSGETNLWNLGML